MNTMKGILLALGSALLVALLAVILKVGLGVLIILTFGTGGYNQQLFAILVDIVSIATTAYIVVTIINRRDKS